MTGRMNVRHHQHPRFAPEIREEDHKLPEPVLKVAAEGMTGRLDACEDGILAPPNSKPKTRKL
jgi:hypothetical protein